MFGKKPTDNDRSTLGPVMDRILDEMEAFGPDSPEYPALLSNLERIVNLRASKDNRRIDPNTILIVAGNLLGILCIVAYEQKNVITSKATSFILKSAT